MTSIKSGDSSFSGSQSSAPSVVPPRPVHGHGPGPGLEGLLFKATNPTNKIEDVNTIKAFCDAVNEANPEGSVLACRLLAHKIQSPQEREAVQALAVLEACVKSCGRDFHLEVGKFKFLNEMIKLVSPRYLASRTPEHIKKKVIEMLYLWTIREDLKGETKIQEAYAMLKTQGIVKNDPVHVGGAVFASSLPPRKKEPLTPQETDRLRKLLQSKNPDDLQKANKIIKGMVQEDERRLDAATKRHTELTMVKNNTKLLSEMLDHYDKNSSGQPELDLLKELLQSCEKMQPKLLMMASETTDDFEGMEEENQDIVEILQASDEMTKTIERYKRVIMEQKDDIQRLNKADNSELLLDLNLSAQEDHQPDQDILGLDALDENVNKDEVKKAPESNGESTLLPTVDDLLMDPPEGASSFTSNILPALSNNIGVNATNEHVKNEEEKSSRQRGLDELDLLGESALIAQLPKGQMKSPQFTKKHEKLSLNDMQKQKIIKDTKVNNISDLSKQELDLQKVPIQTAPEQVPNTKEDSKIAEVKIADLTVPLASIKPGDKDPMTLSDGSDDGISIVLHFGKDQPRPGVFAIVVTIISKMPVAVSDFEFKAVVPKGCKVKLQPPSAKEMPAHSPFVPPSAITQVMLIANPSAMDVSLKYVLSYLVDGEPQTEMGEVAKLPI